MSEYHSTCIVSLPNSERAAVIIKGPWAAPKDNSRMPHLVHLRVQRPERAVGGLYQLMQEYEAKIRALEQLADKQALELEMLREV